MLIKNASDHKVYLHGHKSWNPWEGREIKGSQEIIRLLRCPELKEVKQVKKPKKSIKKKSK